MKRCLQSACSASSDPCACRSFGFSTTIALDGLNTQALCVFVDDADAHCARARAAGAQIAEPPTTTDYGDDYWADRTYRAVDLEGHQWWFMQRLREPKPRAS